LGSCRSWCFPLTFDFCRITGHVPDVRVYSYHPLSYFLRVASHFATTSLCTFAYVNPSGVTIISKALLMLWGNEMVLVVKIWALNFLASCYAMFWFICLSLSKHFRPISSFHASDLPFKPSVHLILLIDSPSRQNTSWIISSRPSWFMKTPELLIHVTFLSATPSPFQGIPLIVENQIPKEMETVLDNV